MSPRAKLVASFGSVGGLPLAVLAGVAAEAGHIILVVAAILMLLGLSVVAGALMSHQIGGAIAKISGATDALGASIASEADPDDGPGTASGEYTLARTRAGRSVTHLVTRIERMANEVRRRDSASRTLQEDQTSRITAANSALRSAQTDLQRYQRLSALGSMAAALVAKLDPALGALSHELGQIGASLKENSTAHEHAERASAQTHRLRRRVSEFRDIIERERVGATRSVPCGLLVKSVVGSLAPTLRKRDVAVCLDYHSPRTLVRGDIPALQRALSYIVESAALAMPHSGRLDVLTRVVGGMNVEITVKDTGSAAPRDGPETTGARAPWSHGNRGSAPYTTDETEPGLTAALLIAQAHDGTINSHPRAGRGNSVTLVLPAAQGKNPGS